MRLDESTGVLPPPDNRQFPRFRVRRWVRIPLILLAVGIILAGSTQRAIDAKWRAVDITVQAWDWDMIGWMASAIGEKVIAGISQPVRGVSGERSRLLVEDYLARASAIGRIEHAMDDLFATADGLRDRRLIPLESELKLLREQQELFRPAVEQILEQQVGHEVMREGLSLANSAFPPVLFTFSEPPRKLVVSPRHRIETIYGSMLQPTLPPDERAAIESAIDAQQDLRAYVASIGGLGTYPALVLDRAPLEWVLSTIAHEWTHNYLTLFPLGINYSQSAELTILNETVADIAGDEIGARVLHTFYPRPPPDDNEEAADAAVASAADVPAADEEPAFDFRAAMQQTRETVDLFLAEDRIEDAEAYMEMRRHLFLENGYNLRRLNQAYFAFHGSYGTGPAASSPIGPKLERLRSLAPDLRTFLETVRWFTSEADIDRALATWEAVENSPFLRVSHLPPVPTAATTVIDSHASSVLQNR